MQSSRETLFRGITMFLVSQMNCGGLENMDHSLHHIYLWEICLYFYEAFCLFSGFEHPISLTATFM